jgi:predicted transcriptional regulator
VCSGCRITPSSATGTVDVDAPIAAALPWFAGKNFSQLPVIKNGKVVGLLTGNTLARWAGGQLAVPKVTVSCRAAISSARALSSTIASR